MFNISQRHNLHETYMNTIAHLLIWGNKFWISWNMIATAIIEHNSHGGIYHCRENLILKYTFPFVYVYTDSLSVGIVRSRTQTMEFSFFLYTDSLHAHPIPEITEENRSAHTQ
jgi:hypothetical protein